MATRGRKPGFVMSDEHRVKIQNSNILNRLIDHALGNVEMTQSQAMVGLGLIKKVLPDLTTTTLQGNDEQPVSIRQIITGVPRAGDA